MSQLPNVPPQAYFSCVVSKPRSIEKVYWDSKYEEPISVSLSESAKMQFFS